MIKPLAVLLVITAVTGCAVADDCTSTIMANFPQALASDAGRLCTSLPVRLDGPQGPVYTVAAFSDGTAGVVTVFDSSMQVAAIPNIHEIYGVVPVLDAVDVDGDARPEILLKMRSAQGKYRSWVLRWDGKTFTNISPVDRDGDTLIGDAELVDLYGDGKRELLEGIRGGGALVYELSDGAYRTSHKLAFLDTFSRRTGKPVTRTSTFTIPAKDAALHHLRLINGTSDGKYRATSVEVSVNAQTLVKQSDVNPKVGSVERDVNLVPGQNTIRVRMSGEAGARIEVLID